jgi:hypothetical protein
MMSEYGEKVVGAGVIEQTVLQGYCKTCTALAEVTRDFWNSTSVTMD